VQGLPDLRQTNLFRKFTVGDFTLMVKVHLRLSVAIATLLSVAFSLVTPSRAQRNAIDTYAITNARIFTVSGPVIDRGTVVIRDGLITAVGANVSAPPDARVIDGTGLTIYPGLIDANTNLGLPEPAPTPSPVGGGGGGQLAALLRPPTPATGPNSTQPVGLQPEVRAEDLIKTGGTQIESVRNAGVTTALSVPRSGIWMGQSALINLAGDTPQQMIVRSPVAMHVGFTPLRGVGYPNSLLGVFASLRQMLLDAERYREAKRIYDTSPRGVRRPSTDRSLEELIVVLDGRMPVIFHADREREIRRALDLAEEFKLKAIIAGGSESWKVVDRLQKSNVPVLLSLNFPRRTTAQMPEADPEPMRVLRDRVDAPKTAARLATAKVRFAFQSGGAPVSDFVANAGKAIENGLLVPDAIQALTIRPAEIFGVADRLGSIEVGKIANLTVMRGDLFDRNSRVAHVFIDGQPMDLRPAPTAPGQTRNIAEGTWNVNVNLGSGDQSVSFVLEQEANQLRGSMQGPLGAAEIANASVGPTGEVRFTIPVTFEGQTAEATFAGRITGNEIRGTVNITGRAPGSFSGTRASQPAPAPTPRATSSDIVGSWRISVAFEGRELPGTLVVSQQGTSVSGSIQTAEYSSQFNGSATDASSFTASGSMMVQGQSVDLNIQARTNGNQISGTVSGVFGQASFTGTRID
jgi:imidazolonepropionase-like amidohydrolase